MPTADPANTERKALAALSRVVQDAVVLVGPDGSLAFRSGGAAELLGGDRHFMRHWRSVQKAIDARVDPHELVQRGEHAFDLALEGEDVPQTLFVRVLPADCEPGSGYFAILRDREGLDAMERDLRRAAQMRRVSDSMAQAAHDLKAPLNAMAMNVAVIRQQLADDVDPETVAERLDVLDREIVRLNRMLQMVLSQSAAPRAAVRRFDLRRLVREGAALVRPQAKRAKVSIKLDLPKSSAVVIGARDHLKQALINLMINGLEAIQGGGELRLAVVQDAETAELRIADTGRGISPDVRAKVFDLHFTTKKSGSGIGLFTARASIQTMGGTLELESEGGEGTCAVVRLPLAAARTEQETACSTS